MTRQFFAKMAAAVMIIAAGLLGTVATAQNRAISGTVVDESGAPVVGAAVVVVGNTSIGAVTDVNGVFRLNVPAGANINVSCIGYADQTIAVGNQTNFRFVLVEDTEFIDETVVIGYGVQRKSDLSGAVSSVREESLKNLSTVDAAAAIQGKVSGVHVMTNGAPGEGASIRVRGYSSNSSSGLGPLYIVDGLQVSSIQYIDPSMIESIEILKDAASAAIYGAQAGNGVVLVTTKSGKEGTASVTYTAKASLQTFTRRPLMNRDEFLRYKTYELGEANVKENLQRFDYSHPYYEGGVIDQDWIDAYFEPTWSQQHSLNFSGGNKNGHFFTSLNWVNQDGVVRGDKDVYKRLTAQVNADYNLFKWLQVGSNNSIEKWSTKSVSQRGYGSAFESVIMMDPLTPVYWTTPEEMSVEVKNMYDQVMRGDDVPAYRFIGDEKGFFANTKYADTEGSPLAKRDQSEGTNSGFNINGTMFANLMPIKGLTITSRLGYRLNMSSSHSYTAPYYIGGRGSNANYSISASANTGWYYQWENFANYLFSLGKHNFTVMGGMSYRESNSDNVSGNASGADILQDYSDNFLYLDYLKSDVTKGTSNAPSKSASLAYYGRLIWSYDNRYGLQTNFRADAFDSSKLSPENRWGYFPSVSGFWNISNEAFFKNSALSNVFDFLKLRASWGRNGNIAVLGGYRYASTISIGSTWYQYGVDHFGTAYGSAPSGLPNSNLHWEISEQTDLGLDFRAFNNRLTGQFEFYNKVTKDLLFSISVPPELGVSSTMANGGNVLNRGWEFELGWRDQIGDFGYSINGNFTLLHNEVLSLPDGASPEYQTPASSTNYQIRTAFEPGYPIWYFNGFIYDGIAEKDITYVDDEGKTQVMVAEGFPIIRDLNGDHEIGTGDMTYIGQTTPKFTYGININLNWKGFDVAMFGSGIGGNSILPVTHRTGYKNNFKWYLENSRTPENPNGHLPNPANVDGDYVYWSSTANLFKGDYFRIKQLQFGYTLPAKITRKVAISNLRFYVSLDDYFTFTKYPGFDPETASTNNTNGAGLDWGSYPTMKKLILGVNLTF
jgi:TonB-linked SusC/RagA family outer membrane protein